MSIDAQKVIFHTILIPTRPQVDTVVGIFLLKEFGEERFPGIASARVESKGAVPEGESEPSLQKRGVVMLDLGGGAFDHHGKKEKTTASRLIAEHLGVADNAAIAKLLAFAERDDFYGKGIISADPLDRAFGIPAVIVNLTKDFSNEPNAVVDIMLPIIRSHYREEVRRTEELPREFNQKLESGDASVFSVKQRKNKLRAVVLSSDNVSMAGYLRSQNGGRHDIVAQIYSSGHINILTRPTKRVDLRPLAVLIRAAELRLRGHTEPVHPAILVQFGRVELVPEWYYDPATNSLHNGGVNPQGVPPTKIQKTQLCRLIELGISEQIWSPLAKDGPF